MSKLFSAALVLLLAFGGVWGECASCPPVKQAKPSCCSGHAGNCKMPAPKPETSKTCPNVALQPVSQQAQDAPTVIAPAPVAAIADAPAVPLELFANATPAPDTGPPGLYLVNSILRV
ncbi:MAG: hypothetical protein ACM336_04905 [Acidobacteriota bacterium]